MRSYQFSDYGERLQPFDAPDPVPGPDEVLLRVLLSPLATFGGELEVLRVLVAFALESVCRTLGFE